MELQDIEKEKWYIVNEIFKNGSKSIYGTNLGTNYIFTQRQLRGIKGSLKRYGYDYEVYEVNIQVLNKV